MKRNSERQGNGSRHDANSGGRTRLAAALWLALVMPTMADTVTFTIGLADVCDESGQKVSTNALFSLIDLGPNGVFDVIPAGQWVGGDDTLIAEAFSNSDGWVDAAAFDLTDGAGQAGVFSRQFTFTLAGDIATGDKVGIRWFPTIWANDFSATNTFGGLTYGQFSRQADTLYGGSTWVVPTGNSFVSFDPLVTTSYDSEFGLDANVLGWASYQVIPEPATIAFFMPVAVALLLLARRRAPWRHGSDLY